MKKTLILTIIIILLCSGFLIYNNVEIRKLNEADFECEILAGDISAAKGIMISQKVALGYGSVGFEWDNTYIFKNDNLIIYQYADDETENEEETTSPDGGNGEETEIIETSTAAEDNDSESEEEKEEKKEKPDDGIQLIRGYVGSYASMKEIAELVAEERGIGTIVKFRDYVDHFSIKERIRVNGVTYVQVDIEDPFISLPIPEDLYFVVLNHKLDFPTGEVDENGELIPGKEYEDDGQLHYYFVDEKGNRVQVYDLTSSYIKGYDRLYFWINNRTPDGELQDTSEIKGGYGIYQIKYETLDELRAEDEAYEEESLKAEENPDAETTAAETDENGEEIKRIRSVHDQSKYSIFFELAEETLIKKVSFGYGEEAEDREKDLLIYTYENEKSYLYVLDPQTAEVRAKLFLGDIPRDEESIEADNTSDENEATEEEDYTNKEHFYIWVKDNCIMVNVGDTTLSVIRKDDSGKYYIERQINLLEITNIAADSWMLGDRTAIKFDEKSGRVVIVDYAGYGGYVRCTGFKIAVFDNESKLAFCAMYDSNLTSLNVTKELEGKFSTPLTNNKYLRVDFE